MRLGRRNLKLELNGDDVRPLQSELIQLGLPIPKPEQERGAFLQNTTQPEGARLFGDGATRIIADCDQDVDPITLMCELLAIIF